MTRASAFGSTILEMGSTKLCVSLTPSSLEDVFTTDVGGADCVEVRLDSLQNPLQSRDGTSAVTNLASAKEALHTWSDRVAIGIDARASVLVGPNIASLRQMLEGTGLRMIASGGVSGLDDVRALLDRNRGSIERLANVGSIRALAAAVRAFDRRCARGLQADEGRARHYAERTVSLATALAPRIGYARAAEIVKASVASGRSIVDLAAEMGGLSPAEARRLLDPVRLTRPGRA